MCQNEASQMATIDVCNKEISHLQMSQTPKVSLNFVFVSVYTYNPNANPNIYASRD